MIDGDADAATSLRDILRCRDCLGNALILGDGLLDITEEGEIFDWGDLCELGDLCA